MSREAKLRRIELLREKQLRFKDALGQRIYESFYEWQRRFNKATATFYACLLMAANQVGKSQTGCSIDSYHLTGDYPDDWEGHKFDFAPRIWLLGYSGEKTRDLLQQKLFGRYVGGRFEGGYISADKIVDHIPMLGTKNGMREVRVRHKLGIATCQFWSYSQGQSALMGDIIDWYHIDEEPKDSQIFPQVITRTLNGDRGRGGRGILTFTPEHGKTQLVSSFMDQEYTGEGDAIELELDSTGQFMMTATWNDAPHLSEEMKTNILKLYPPYQRAMRSKGVPLMGSGLIYEYDEDTLSIAPFKPPDHWYTIIGIDFGWDHPFACVQMVEDRDTGTFYFTKGWKGSKKHPYEVMHIVGEWAGGIPVSWPHDGLKGQLKTSEGNANDGDTLADMYAYEGLLMIDVHATWEEGGNSVQRGIMEFNNLMAAGKIKIFSNLFELFEEIRQYHTKTTASGQTEIVKIGDDLLDACRYAYMMSRYAIRIGDINHTPDPTPARVYEGRDTVTGY